MTAQMKTKKRKRKKTKLYAWYNPKIAYFGAISSVNPMESMSDLVKSMKLMVYELRQIN